MELIRTNFMFKQALQMYSYQKKKKKKNVPLQFQLYSMKRFIT